MAQDATRRPNILHIMSDQQQWATVAGRSECNTPNLNRLASQGLRFERSYTPCAVCCPARAMILSGAFHWHNGVFNQVHSAPSVHRDMYPDVVLYSQRLRDAGYRLGYVGKWHASWVRGPLDFGFHEVADVFAYRDGAKDSAASSIQPPKPKEKLRRTVNRMMRWPGSEPFPMWGYTEGPPEAAPEHYQTDCALTMLRRFTQRGQPWHMEVHYVEPHDPYFPMKSFLDRYHPDAISVPKSFHDDFRHKPGMHRRESETWGDVTEQDVRESRAHYFAFTEQLDAQIGRLLHALDESGQANETIVVFTTDHGDMMGAHRMWIKGWMPYEECYRVPLIICWPGRIAPGSRSGKLVQTHDLAHTYINVTGAAPLPHADGRSLLPLFENPSLPDWPDEILCAYYGGEFLYTQRIAMTNRYKYVFNGFDFDELYDLERDPDEMNNVLREPDYAKAVEEMRGRLYRMMAQFGDPYAASGAPVHGGNPPDRYGATRYLPRRMS
jgi:arylsulfatase A-like enzyme